MPTKHNKTGLRRRGEVPVTTAQFNSTNQLAVICVATVAICGYLVWFFMQPVHQTVALTMFVPDQLIREWFGGTTARIKVRDRLPALALAGLLQFSALGYGAVAMKLFGWREREIERDPAALPLAAAAGMGLQSSIILALGLLGLLKIRILFWILTLLGVPIGGWLIWRTVGRIWKSRSIPSRGQTVAMTVLILMTGYLLLAAVLPPGEFDVREYHSQVPKEWYQAGRVTFLEHNIYGNMPLGAEMGALWSMTLVGGSDGWWLGALSGKLTMAFYSVWTLVLLISAGRRWWSPRAGMAAALLYVGTPWVTRVSIAGLNEGCLGLFYLATIYAVLRGLELRRSRRFMRWLLLAGLVAGCGAGCKYPAFVFVVLPLIAALIWFAAIRWLTWRQVTSVALCMLLGGGMWYAKNWVLTGNPVYPLAANVLGGKSRTPERTEQWNRAHQVPEDKNGRRYSPEQLGRQTAQVAVISNWIGPTLIPLLILGAGIGWRDWRCVILTLILVAWFGGWFLITHRIERFLVPVLPVASLLAGVVWSSGKRHKWRIGCEILLVIAVVYGGIAGTSRLCGDNRILVALQDLRYDTAHDADPEMRRANPLHVFLNRQAAREAGDAVLFIGDAQPFDLEMPVYYHTCFDEPQLARWFKDKPLARDRWDVLRRHHIRYVLVDWDEIARYKNTYGFSEFITPELILGELAGHQRILRLIDLPVDRHVQLFEVAPQPPK